MRAPLDTQLRRTLAEIARSVTQAPQEMLAFSKSNEDDTKFYDTFGDDNKYSQRTSNTHSSLNKNKNNNKKEDCRDSAATSGDAKPQGQPSFSWNDFHRVRNNQASVQHCGTVCEPISTDYVRDFPKLGKASAPMDTSVVTRVGKSETVSISSRGRKGRKKKKGSSPKTTLTLTSNDSDSGAAPQGTGGSEAFKAAEATADVTQLTEVPAASADAPVVTTGDGEMDAAPVSAAPAKDGAAVQELPITHGDDVSTMSEGTCPDTPHAVSTADADSKHDGEAGTVVAGPISTDYDRDFPKLGKASAPMDTSVVTRAGKSETVSISSRGRKGRKKKMFFR